ncbi:DUF4062 domain-containing protein [uncultured Serinicoccus sp.]|uniref:DUF4062 domain-containing protein n=1 Tax=uncultured Serinicoccus sp. TaxID=735514 RepID=UPI002625DD04|nr:DUF4062 domain-containing protein [uncultured Serinicoccus sp.]
MAAQPKYQVFVSSTFEDLQGERDQVIRAVLEMGHIPVGMEMFSAADEEQWGIISRHIDQSDYYVVIVAHRLGSVTDEGVSFTRKEYEYAREQGVPCLGFVIDDQAPWPGDKFDSGESDRADLIDFKRLVKEKPVSFWANADDLHAKCSIALMKAFTANPRDGWVRASSAGGAEMAAEVVRLSAENAELRNQLKAAGEASKKEQRDEIVRVVRMLFSNKRKPSYRYRGSSKWHDDSEVSLFHVFKWLGPEMMVESTVEDLAGTLAMHVRTDPHKTWDLVAYNQLKELLADFVTLGLAEPSTKKHAVSDNNEYWSLTEFGLEVLRRVRQVNMSEHDESDEEPAAPSKEHGTQGEDG